MESYFLLPEGGDLSEMGTSVGPKMLETYGIISRPQFNPGDPAQLILNSPPPPAVEPARPSFAAPQSPGLIVPPMSLGTYIPPAQEPAPTQRQFFAAPTSPGLITPPMTLGTYVPTETTPVVSAPQNQQTVRPATVRYTPQPEPVPVTTYTEPAAPDLSKVTTVTKPTLQKSAQQIATAAAPKDEFPDYPGYKLGDLVPNMPGVRVGDYFEDGAGRVYNWRTGEWSPAPTPPGGGVEQLTPEDVAKVTEGQTPTTSTPTVTPGTGSPTPGTEIQEAPSEYVPARVILEPIKYPDVPEITFTPFTPSKTTTSRPLRGIQYTPLNPLRTVPLPQRATDNFIPEPYDTPNYIQYDPEQILAAAMRAIGNQRIRQSIVDQAMENRMLERMRG